MPTFRELWDTRRPIYGGWCTIPGTVSAEIVGRAGYDWVCIDTQHGLMGYDTLLPMLQALTASRAPSVVRVLWNDPATIMKTLDAGAEGVIVPMINTATDAEAAVAACRYAPAGMRSWGPIRQRLLDPEFTAERDSDVVCIAMCETTESMKNLEEICSVPGLDGIFVGPNDLAISMGIRDSDLSGKVAAHGDAIRSIQATCARKGLATGIMCGSPEVGRQWRDVGFTLLAIESDSRLLTRAAETHARQCRELD